jgi:hypothetical protein
VQFSQVSGRAERKSSGDHLLVSCYFLDRLESIVDGPRHIFCHACAESLGLFHPTTSDRHCPACQTVLLNPDDAVSTILNPTEDYKSSVLSGLDPNTIMECAGRALGFWAYQSTQEMYVSISRWVTPRLTLEKLLPGVPSEDPHGEVRQLEHTNGQGHPQRQHRDNVPTEQVGRSVQSSQLLEFD